MIPKPDSTPPAGIGRGMAASLVLCGLAAVVYLAAGWSAGPRSWGVHALGFLPRAAWFVAASVFAFALWPRGGARLGAAPAWVATRVLQRPLLLCGLAAAAGILFGMLRLRFQFLGDGVVWLDKIEHRESFHHFEPLATSIAAAVARGAGQATAAGRPAIVLGVAYVLGLAALGACLWRDAASRGLAWLLALLHPALLLFFGYVESYPYLLVLQILFALVLVRAASSRSPLWMLAVAGVLGLAIATHLQALGWLPALVLLPWVQRIGAGPDTRGPRHGPGSTLLWSAFGSVGALAVALVFILLVGASPGQLLAELGGESGLGGLRSGVLWDVRRLVDLGNEIALVLTTSLLTLVPALVARGRTAMALAGSWALVGALVPGPLLFLLLVPPRIGGARDWDLYLAVFLPVLLLAVEAWRRAFASPAAGRAVRGSAGTGSAAAAAVVAGRALAVALVVSGSYLAVQLDAQRAARRLLVLQQPGGTFGSFARGYANETLAQFWRTRDEGLAREAYLRATLANPNNARYQNNLATLYLRVNEIGPARAAFRRAYELGMHDWFVLHNLGLCELQLHDPRAAEPLFDELVQKRPQMWQAWQYRGIAKLDQGRAAEALPDVDRAVELAPREADTHYTRGTVLRALGRNAEARACFEAALRLAPTHQPARDALARLPAAP